MPELIRQVGFCRVCGNSVHSDQEFARLDGAVCHSECIG